MAFFAPFSKVLLCLFAIIVVADMNVAIAEGIPKEVKQGEKKEEKITSTSITDNLISKASERVDSTSSSTSSGITNEQNKGNLRQLPGTKMSSPPKKDSSSSSSSNSNSGSSSSSSSSSSSGSSSYGSSSSSRSRYGATATTSAAADFSLLQYRALALLAVFKAVMAI